MLKKRGEPIASPVDRFFSMCDNHHVTCFLRTDESIGIFASPAEQGSNKAYGITPNAPCLFNRNFEESTNE